MYMKVTTNKNHSSLLHRRTLCTLYPPREMDKIGSEIGIEIDEKSL